MSQNVYNMKHDVAHCARQKDLLEFVVVEEEASRDVESNRSVP